MADLSITAANVVAAAGSKRATGTAGAAITAGQIVYLDATDSKYKLFDADMAGVGNIRKVFMALNGAANNQPLTVLASGEVTINAVMTAGTTYYGSPNAGGVAPVADLLAGDNVIVLGVAKTTTVLTFDPIIAGVTLA
jgi:hypothetical protein